MLRVAAQVALEVGIHRFSVNEVSSRSGIARTTISRHFPTREELLVAALDEVIPVPPTPDTGSLRDDLAEFLSALIPVFADRRIRSLFLDILAAAGRDPALEDLQRAMMRRREGPSRAIYERGRSRGEIADDIDYEDFFLTIEAPLVMRGLGPPGALDEIDVDRHVARILRVLEPTAPGSSDVPT